MRARPLGGHRPVGHGCAELRQSGARQKDGEEKRQTGYGEPDFPGHSISLLKNVSPMGDPLRVATASGQHVSFPAKPRGDPDAFPGGHARPDASETHFA
jgi:hypothetical protein